MWIVFQHDSLPTCFLSNDFRFRLGMVRCPSPNQRKDERHTADAGFVLIFFANACNNPASKESNPLREYAVYILSDALAVDVYHINTDGRTVIKHHSRNLCVFAVIAHRSQGRGYAGRRRRLLCLNWIRAPRSRHASHVRALEVCRPPPSMTAR